MLLCCACVSRANDLCYLRLNWSTLFLVEIISSSSPVLPSAYSYVARGYHSNWLILLDHGNVCPPFHTLLRDIQPAVSLQQASFLLSGVQLSLQPLKRLLSSSEEYSCLSSHCSRLLSSSEEYSCLSSHCNRLLSSSEEYSCLSSHCSRLLSSLKTADICKWNCVHIIILHYDVH